MATLYKYRIDLGWSSRKLAEEAGISHPVARNAENGKPIQAESAKALADALSKAYGKEIKPSEIEGLNVL
ncbi:MAG TPA: helix-turn-helix transcriptional regulator [Ktedonobacteraceae bacterium]